ncbi:hypothetical protein H3S93_03170 [Bifidobacterium sp. W8109]|nr:MULTISPECIES: hypothetical protein [Bifidobacterium]MBH9971314.1 hypothetical protein [Bifidobacterium asteroides]MBH9979893.1 hypothetical protein [Bifidobacterium asteroides]MBI0072363.1 hypothetical protein [Bifidobacterium sp. W8110]MBI0099638.1 hypothetical protein [Bifidobacterium sp. W8114]
MTHTLGRIAALLGPLFLASGMSRAQHRHPAARTGEGAEFGLLSAM